MMSANPGEPLRPLAKVASGGETARIMLALKRVLAQTDQTPTLITTIDQGIGGRVGSVVGEKLWALASNHQVLCVAHLAQLAGYGDKHYRVSKSGSGRTSAGDPAEQHRSALKNWRRCWAPNETGKPERTRHSGGSLSAQGTGRLEPAEQPRQQTLL
ncbi:MAG: hypothetical protein U0694_28315 [Anaerolineae bacterium]